MANPVTVNEKLLQASLRHGIGLSRLSSSQVSDLSKLLDEADADLVEKLEKRKALILKSGYDRGPYVTARLEAMLDEIRTVNAEAYELVGKQLTAEMKKLAAYEAEWATSALDNALPVRLSFVRPTVEQLNSIVTDLPMTGDTLLKAVSKTARQRFEAIEGPMRLGLVQGETIDQMVRRASKTLSDLRKPQVTTLVRTAVIHTSNAARSALYLANPDVLKGVSWVATLDTPTCPTCRGLDGLVFPMTEGPRPPAHYQCRCTIAPVTKSWKELGLDGKELGEVGRASMNGRIPDRWSFTRWLRDQTPSFQDEILGPKRGAIYRANPEMHLSKFLDSNWDEMSLVELAKAEGILIPASVDEALHLVSASKLATEALATEALATAQAAVATGELTTFKQFAEAAGYEWSGVKTGSPTHKLLLERFTGAKEAQKKAAAAAQAKALEDAVAATQGLKAKVVSGEVKTLSEFRALAGLPDNLPEPLQKEVSGIFNQALDEFHEKASLRFKADLPKKVATGEILEFEPYLATFSLSDAPAPLYKELLDEFLQSHNSFLAKADALEAEVVAEAVAQLSGEPFITGLTPVTKALLSDELDNLAEKALAVFHQHLAEVDWIQSSGLNKSIAYLRGYKGDLAKAKKVLAAAISSRVRAEVKLAEDILDYVRSYAGNVTYDLPTASLDGLEAALGDQLSGISLKDWFKAKAVTIDSGVWDDIRATFEVSLPYYFPNANELAKLQVQVEAWATKLADRILASNKLAVLSKSLDGKVALLVERKDEILGASEVFTGDFKNFVVRLQHVEQDLGAMALALGEQGAPKGVLEAYQKAIAVRQETLVAMDAFLDQRHIMQLRNLAKGMGYEDIQYATKPQLIQFLTRTPDEVATLGIPDAIQQTKLTFLAQKQAKAAKLQAANAAAPAASLPGGSVATQAATQASELAARLSQVQGEVTAYQGTVKKIAEGVEFGSVKGALAALEDSHFYWDAIDSNIRYIEDNFVKTGVFNNQTNPEAWQKFTDLRLAWKDAMAEAAAAAFKEKGDMVPILLKKLDAEWAVGAPQDYQVAALTLPKGSKPYGISKEALENLKASAASAPAPPVAAPVVPPAPAVNLVAGQAEEAVQLLEKVFAELEAARLSWLSGSTDESLIAALKKALAANVQAKAVEKALLAPLSPFGATNGLDLVAEVGQDVANSLADLQGLIAQRMDDFRYSVQGLSYAQIKSFASELGAKIGNLKYKSKMALKIVTPSPSAISKEAASVAKAVKKKLGGLASASPPPAPVSNAAPSVSSPPVSTAQAKVLAQKFADDAIQKVDSPLPVMDTEDLVRIEPIVGGTDFPKGQVPAEMLYGKPWTKAAPNWWKAIPENALAEPSFAPAKADKLRAGVIIREADGRVWLQEFSGDVSLPQVTVGASESAQKAAMRGAYERLGLEVRIVGHAGDYADKGVTTRFYYAERIGGSPEFGGTDGRLTDIESALLQFSKDRDKAALYHFKLGIQSSPSAQDVAWGQDLLSKTSGRAPTSAPPPLPKSRNPWRIETLDGSKWRSTGRQQGSNPGGFYTDTEGAKWYVKLPDNLDHVREELVANRLYAAAGGDVPEVHLVRINGKTGIASRIQEGQVGVLPKELARNNRVTDYFATDAWLGNWDVAGANFDNVLVTATGRAFRIDPGGSLRYRAQGALKGSDFSHRVAEIETLLDPSMNPQTAAIFSGLTPERIIDQIRRLEARFTDKLIDQILGSVDGLKNRDTLKGILVARRRWLSAYADELEKQTVGQARLKIQAAKLAAQAYQVVKDTAGTYQKWGVAAYRKIRESVARAGAELKSAVRNYTGSGYRDWNRALWLNGYKNGEVVVSQLGASQRSATEALDKLLDQAVVQEDLVVWRGSDPGASQYLERYFELKEGDLYIDHAYMSSASYQGKAWSNKPILMEIRLPAGFRGALYVDELPGGISSISSCAGEKEVVIRRNVRWRVVEIKRSQRGTNLGLHLVLEPDETFMARGV